MSTIKRAARRRLATRTRTNTTTKKRARSSARSGVADRTRSARAAAPTEPAILAHEPLQLTLEKASPDIYQTDVLVVGAFADGTLPPLAQPIDKASRGKLAAAVKRGDLDEKPGSSLMLQDVPGIAAPRVVLVSLGMRREFGEKAFLEALAGAARALAGGTAENAVVSLIDVDIPGYSLEWRVQQASRVLADGAYRFAAPMTETDGRRTRGRGARNIALLTAGPVTPGLEGAVRRGQAIAEGMALAKDLGNLPANICNPTFLAETAQALGKEFGFDVQVLEREDMERLGMGAALSVGQASAQPSKFIVMHYAGNGASTRPIVLVGKGVTFDTGGISLKPGARMDEMKFDMCGAASVFGAMRTAARLALPLDIVGLIPAAENMPGGRASRPGDVVTSMSGQTIEILNTDAEGRLLLCDALTYAERFAPACVVDIATLTGACVIALGNVASGLFANDDQLAAELLEYGTATGDRAWQLPLWDDYQVQLRSNFADMSNIGGQPAGAVTAACFLSRFTRNYKWAHLDIAGTNALSGDDKGATGRPVPLLSEFLLGRAQMQA